MIAWRPSSATAPVWPTIRAVAKPSVACRSKLPSSLKRQGATLGKTPRRPIGTEVAACPTPERLVRPERSHVTSSARDHLSPTSEGRHESNENKHDRPVPGLYPGGRHGRGRRPRRNRSTTGVLGAMDRTADLPGLLSLRLRHLGRQDAPAERPDALVRSFSVIAEDNHNFIRQMLEDAGRTRAPDLTASVSATTSPRMNEPRSRRPKLSLKPISPRSTP